jgi:hypothetical protein
MAATVPKVKIDPWVASGDALEFLLESDYATFPNLRDYILETPPAWISRTTDDPALAMANFIHQYERKRAASMPKRRKYEEFLTNVSAAGVVLNNALQRESKKAKLEMEEKPPPEVVPKPKLTPKPEEKTLDYYGTILTMSEAESIRDPNVWLPQIPLDVLPDLALQDSMPQGVVPDGWRNPVMLLNEMIVSIDELRSLSSSALLLGATITESASVDPFPEIRAKEKYEEGVIDAFESAYYKMQAVILTYLEEIQKNVETATNNFTKWDKGLSDKLKRSVMVGRYWYKYIYPFLVFLNNNILEPYRGTFGEKGKKWGRLPDTITGITGLEPPSLSEESPRPVFPRETLYQLEIWVIRLFNVVWPGFLVPLGNPLKWYWEPRTKTPHPLTSGVTTKKGKYKEEDNAAWRSLKKYPGFYLGAGGKRKDDLDYRLRPLGRDVNAFLTNFFVEMPDAIQTMFHIDEIPDLDMSDLITFDDKNGQMPEFGANDFEDVASPADWMDYR